MTELQYGFLTIVIFSGTVCIGYLLYMVRKLQMQIDDMRRAIRRVRGVAR